MIFEHRNKAYGAYQLRSTYNQSLLKAFFITASGVLALLGALFISQHLHAERVITKVEKPIEDTLREVPLVTPPAEPEKPKPQRNPEAHNTPTIKHPEMRVVENLTHEHEDSIPSRDDLFKFEPGLVTNLQGEPHEIIEEPQTKTTGTSNSNIIDVAELMPEFPGGEAKMREFLRNNTNYPDMERENGISGKAIVQFVVNEDGHVSDIVVLRSDTRNFSKEGQRVVGMLPDFTPGKQGGKNVRVRMVMPFKWESH